MGLILNHMTARMHHSLAHQAAFHQRCPVEPSLKHYPDFTRQRCEGFQRATLLLAVVTSWTVASPWLSIVLVMTVQCCV